jgi:hypothetical protein
VAKPTPQTLGDQILVKRAIGVDVVHPGIFIEGFLKFADVIIIKGVNVELNNSDNLVVIICSRSHVMATASLASLAVSACPAIPTRFESWPWITHPVETIRQIDIDMEAA